VEEINSAPKRKPFFGIILSDTLLLAAIPFIAYLFTFIYQAGYLQAFQLPSQFVSITIVDIFNIGGKILGVIFLVFSSVNLFSNFLPKGNMPNSLARRARGLLLLFLLAYPFLFLFEWGTISNIVLVVLIFVILIMFLPPLVSRKYRGTYLQKMEQLTGEAEKDINPWKEIY